MYIDIAPLVFIDPDSEARNPIAVLIGIASWGGACGAEEYPSVYATVRDAVPWIRRKTGRTVLS